MHLGVNKILQLIQNFMQHNCVQGLTGKNRERALQFEIIFLFGNIAQIGDSVINPIY